MQKLIIATHNKGKLKEFREIFKDKFEVLALPYNGYDGEVEETGTTFYENSLLKAKDVFLHTNEITLADDSGLCVDALGGAPGIFSARYGGKDITQQEKNALIIENLKKFSDKSAKFVCTLVLYGKDGVIASGVGEVKGHIIDEERGKGGFGYDPIFYCDEIGKTFGEAHEDEKNRVSHRSRAIEDLIRNLK